jgi:thiamine biosynthesis lipoprotein
MNALRDAFMEIRRIQDLMSVHRSESEVGILNRNGFCDDVSQETKFVIQRANGFSERSHGVFDITVLPLLALWEERAREGQVPTQGEIRERLDLVDYREVVLDDRRIRFGRPGMGITLSGVAKGYAVDRSIETLRRAGIRHGLVNAGGDIRALGGRTDGRPWKIGIRDPRSRGRTVTTVDLADGAVATSGTYQRPFNDILHPRTGRPVQGVLSATVTAETAMDADMLATCFLVSGGKERFELPEGLGEAKAFVIRGDGTILN